MMQFNAMLLRSKFAKAIPQKDFPKLAKELEKKMFSIPEMGPYLVVDQYNAKGESVVNAPVAADDQCDACYQSKSTLKKCSVCRRAKYCSVECQKSAWPQHKLECKRDPDPATQSAAPATVAAPTAKLDVVD